MKIKVCQKSYEDVLTLPKPPHRKPLKPSFFLQTVMRLASIPDLRAVDFRFETESEQLERAGKGPWLILMNHSSFLDLEIASRMLYPRRYCIVCTSDGLVGKEALMRRLGCIPTQKFVSDFTLISDIKHSLVKNKTSVLMYPEASYSFDGSTTPLPEKLGALFKLLKVPVVMITTYGSFARDPLYNNLQKRNVTVSAKLECLVTPDEIESHTVEQLDGILNEAFSHDYFKWQYDNRIKISEPFRADGLHRILYKCPSCGTEGLTEGSGIGISCKSCGKSWIMDDYGRLSAKDGKTEFSHIPDWYRWEREQVKNEIINGTYSLNEEVEIGLIVDFKALYMVGNGRLRHSSDGFTLDGCEGLLHYTQSTKKGYSLYSDFYWYELGDVICIGNRDCLYYCFPKHGIPVAKVRLAAEELYKISKPAVREK